MKKLICAVSAIAFAIPTFVFATSYNLVPGGSAPFELSQGKGFNPVLYPYFKSGVLSTIFTTSSGTGSNAVSLKCEDANKVCSVSASTNANSETGNVVLKYKTAKMNAGTYSVVAPKKVLPDSLDKYSSMFQHTTYPTGLWCESVAISDVLATFENRSVDYKNVFNTLPKFEVIRNIDANGKKYWADPDLGFVDFVQDLPKEYVSTFGKEADQYKMTGYGTTEKPIANFFKNRGYQTDSGNVKEDGLTPETRLTKILTAVAEGKQVITLADICTAPEYRVKTGFHADLACPYIYNNARKVNWFVKQADGTEKLVEGRSGEHAFIILGYEGGVTNPTSVIVYDTYLGKRKYPTSEWMRKWDFLHDQYAIISPK